MTDRIGVRAVRSKRLLATFVSAGVAVGVMTSPAIADPVNRGCPDGDGWTLEATWFFIDEVDNGSAADQNGDGLACWRVNKCQTAKHGPGSSFTWKDNTNPLP